LRIAWDYDDPIADYWPSFAAHGKATITIRHVLCHTAGIPQMPKHVILDMMGLTLSVEEPSYSTHSS